MWNLKAAIFCSIGRLERKLIFVSVVVSFLYMSTSSLVCLRVTVRSRNAMELCSSYVGLSFVLFCILFIYVLMVCKLIFVVSYMTNMSSTYRTYALHIQKLFYIRVFITLQVYFRN